MPAERFSGAALVPGLVNVHTHLELTGLECAADPADFPQWIRMVRELKSRRSPEEFLAAVRRGIRDCWAAGVTTVADTGDSGSVPLALAEAGASGIAYVEVFGPDPAQRAHSLLDLEQRLAQLGPHARGRLRVGVSPHAPYSVSGPLYESVALWARARGLPLAVHVAESDAECALLDRCTGPFADMWARRGIPMPEPRGDSPIAWLARHGVLGADTLCIHVVKASAADIELLAAHGTAIAHCPLSNRAHAHGEAPLAAFLKVGLRVGCGTDSVLSVAPLDLLAEARAARTLGSLSALRALSLCTLDAARAVGMENEIGSLDAGKWGDVAVIHLGRAHDADPIESVLASRLNDVVATFLGGRAVHRRGVVS